MLRKTVKALCFVLLSATVLITCGCAGGKQTSNRPDEQPLLANKEHPLTATYAPARLTDLPADLTLYGKEISMESEAAEAAVRLLHALHDAGYTDIVITSGYRTYEYQQTPVLYLRGKRAESAPRLVAREMRAGGADLLGFARHERASDGSLHGSHQRGKRRAG